MELKMHPHRSALTAIAFSTDGEEVWPQSNVLASSSLHHIFRPWVGLTEWHHSLPVAQVRPSSLEIRTDWWLSATPALE